MFSEAVLALLAQQIDSKYPLQHDPLTKPLAYGTAGFRTTGGLLPPVAARVVVIAILRACSCCGGKNAEQRIGSASVGFMITASHNPAVDNGFKIIDHDGGMLAPSWEHWCTKAANAVNGAELVRVVKSCMESENVHHTPKSGAPCGLVLLGRDTRGSGETIEAAATSIIDDVIHAPFTSFGVLTTPQLHFLVAKANEAKAKHDDVRLDAYHEQILSSFESLLLRACKASAFDQCPKQQIVVDCANGVGAIGLRRLLDFSKNHSKEDILSRLFTFALVNENTEDPCLLNERCGADYAKQHATPSTAMEKWPQLAEDKAEPAATHFYCLDGDADRIVAFLYSEQENTPWVLLDGDRIAILYAMLLRRWLGEGEMRNLDVGVVQTAYANGASTDFLKEALHVPVYVAATGVKNLHPVAHARDIGVYFEANGHGTALFADGVTKKLESEGSEMCAIISSLRELLSQVCGDALGDLLTCEVALKALDMNFTAWAALYTDRPCKQVKVTVADPKRITNTPDEQRALTPEGLQEEIDAAVSAAQTKCGTARSFVRPSGTEPVVRVYAEASTPAVCEELTEQVCGIVSKYCN